MLAQTQLNTRKMSEKIIWDFLSEKIGNPFGVAGLMGNLYVESHLNPALLQSSYSRKLGLSSQQYTEAVDNGLYTNFIHDSAGYGLAQWTFWSRKEALLNYAKSKNKSIGDLTMQLEYLWIEIQKYAAVIKVLKSATSVREASDIVTEKYERPKDQSEKAKQNRATCGQLYFNLYSGRKNIKQVVVTADRVNIRLGNGKEFARIFLTNSGSSYDWIATAENGWHAIRLKDQVGWVSGEFSKVQ